MSINIQKYIHSVCAKITDLLKILHLKLKEISAINRRIARSKVEKKTSFNKGIKIIKSRTLKLKAALKKEKLKIKKVMDILVKKQAKLLKVLSIYDKSFVNKNRTGLNNILSSINVQLKSFMALPYFHEGYQNFISKVITISRKFSPAQLKNYQTTASQLISKFWKQYLSKAKKEWGKHRKVSNKKKNNKKGKRSSIKRIK